MLKNIRRIAVALLLFALFYTADSQNDNYYFYNDYESWEGGLSIGVNSFYGDVNDNTNKIFPATPFQRSFYKDRHFVVGGYFGKRMTPFWTLALDFKFGRVSGSDKYENLAFRTSWNTEVVISNSLDVLAMANLETDWSLYPKIGFGIYAFRSTLRSTLTDEVMDCFPAAELIDDGTVVKATGYRCAFAMPIALGVGFRPLPELRVFFETGITWVANDFLDAYASPKPSFEGVWNTMIGVSYQFDFTPRRGANPRYATANDALKDDGVTRKYKKMRNRSNLGNGGHPKFSKSSAMKKHK
ncbi:MAG: hypothetical protein J6Y35_02600 [Bacteroidales bacterium]|nr:hypothetical protein [Bacteroidales bacterium]